MLKTGQKRKGAGHRESYVEVEKDIGRTAGRCIGLLGAAGICGEFSHHLKA